jgi:hypothetical protein
MKEGALRGSVIIGTQGDQREEGAALGYLLGVHTSTDCRKHEQ